MLKVVASLSLVALTGLASAAESRMDRSKLQIGVYCLAPCARTDAHVRDVRDCNVDFIYGVASTDRATLDLCAKYGHRIAWFVFASDDPFNEHPCEHNCRFRPTGKFKITGKDGPIASSAGADGSQMFKLGSSEFALIEMERPKNAK